FNSKLKAANSIITTHFRSKIKHHYPSIHSCSATLTPAAIESLLEGHPSIKRIHTDREIKALLDVARPSVKANAPTVKGLSGKGVTIAVVDTGIYTHKDLAGRIKAFKDLTGNKTAPYDDNGHGTHCAGDAAGNGTSSNGKYKGLAPEADLVGVKVLNKTGSGSLSTVMAGVQWCIDNKVKYNINIISMSLGSRATASASEDPMVMIVEKAWDQGIVVLVAAGNEGPDEKTISSPGISPKVITVGAMDDKNTDDRVDDKAAEFSSRGPTIDGLIKPDILSPGVNIISLRSPNSYLDKTYKSNRVNTEYFTLSGTSMATPICAGVAALILQAHPALTPDQVKQRLSASAENWNLPQNVQGSGYNDAEKAVTMK
ncbi:MAG TPA: S8 family peptidase, partial [Syntrophomonadaceae bacterium]|nr:S8 family peptidase [Syntrophomonadaceae bacterium]